MRRPWWLHRLKCALQSTFVTEATRQRTIGTRRHDINIHVYVHVFNILFHFFFISWELPINIYRKNCCKKPCFSSSCFKQIKICLQIKTKSYHRVFLTFTTIGRDFVLRNILGTKMIIFSSTRALKWKNSTVMSKKSWNWNNIYVYINIYIYIYIYIKKKQKLRGFGGVKTARIFVLFHGFQL